MRVCGRMILKKMIGCDRLSVMLFFYCFFGIFWIVLCRIFVW